MSESEKLQTVEIVVNRSLTLGNVQYNVTGLSGTQGGLSQIFELESTTEPKKTFFLKIDKYPIRSEVINTSILTMQEFEALALQLISSVRKTELNVEIVPINLLWHGDVVFQNATYHAILTEKLPDGFWAIHTHMRENSPLTDPSMALNFLSCLVQFTEEIIQKGFATRDFKFDNVRLRLKNGFLECVILDANIGTIQFNNNLYTCFGAENVAGTFPTRFPIMMDNLLKRLRISFELEADSMRWGALILAFLIIFKKYPFNIGNNEITMEEFFSRRISPRELEDKFEKISDAILSGNATFAEVPLPHGNEFNELYKAICEKLLDLLKKYNISIE